MTLVEEEGRLAVDFSLKLEQEKSLDLEKGIHDDNNDIFDVVDNSNNHKEEEDDGGVEFDSSMINKSTMKSTIRQSFFYLSPRSCVVTQNQQEKETFPLKNSVYSLIIITPIFSLAFLVSMYWILLKYLLFAMLLPNTNEEGTFKVPHNKPLLIAKFLLIPVNIGMQTDLIHAVSAIGRIKYDPAMSRIAKNATHFKYNLSLVLQLIDGILSLAVNVAVMMRTDELLSIFLNFASLHFLQEIDICGYELIEKGFFGRTMEIWCDVVRQIELPRRQSDKWLHKVTTSLFFGTALVLLITYGVIVYSIYGPSKSDCVFHTCYVDDDALW